jgi:hypothetical protein
MEPTTYQIHLYPVFLHRPQSHNANARLEWQQIRSVVATSLREYPHTATLLEFIPGVLINFRVFEFWNDLVGGACGNRGFRFVCNCELLVGLDGFDLEFAQIANVEGTPWLDLRKFGPLPPHNLPLECYHTPLSLDRHILRPLQGYGMHHPNHMADNGPPHRLGSRDKANNPGRHPHHQLR